MVDDESTRSDRYREQKKKVFEACNDARVVSLLRQDKSRPFYVNRSQGIRLPSVLVIMTWQRQVLRRSGGFWNDENCLIFKNKNGYFPGLRLLFSILAALPVTTSSIQMILICYLKNNQIIFEKDNENKS